ncbi:unnamed protein product [Penicillium nalgiovense]|nr:unnamed protein product [Penicillium nalgiovense]
MIVCQYSIFQRTLQRHLDRFLSAGEAFPLSVCYFADLSCCEVSPIALLDAACSASSAPSRSPPEVTLHSPWCRRSTLGLQTPRPPVCRHRRPLQCIRTQSINLDSMPR